MLVYKPTKNFNVTHFKSFSKIFLAGSIELDSAEHWQKKVENVLDVYDDDLILFNPRRDDWDSTIIQTINDDRFSEQVNWELDHLEMSDIIFMYFDPNTKSPISLLELGLYINKKPMVVVCPDGFWRKGNVEIVCDRYKVPVLNTLKDGIDFTLFYLLDLSLKQK